MHLTMETVKWTGTQGLYHLLRHLQEQGLVQQSDRMITESIENKQGTFFQSFANKLLEHI